MKFVFQLFMITSFLSNILGAETLAIGSPAPQVSAVDHSGNTIDLSAALSEGISVVFFYPKAMTPGCTAQACSLRDAWDELQKLDIKVFGVSADTAKTQAAFRDKHKLPFTLIADRDQAVIRAFGKGKWSRQAYIFKDGELVWKDLKASTKKQADDVLQALSQFL